MGLFKRYSFSLRAMSSASVEFVMISTVDSMRIKERGSSFWLLILMLAICHGCDKRLLDRFVIFCCINADLIDSIRVWGGAGLPNYLTLLDRLDDNLLKVFCKIKIAFGCLSSRCWFAVGLFYRHQSSLSLYCMLLVLLQNIFPERHDCILEISVICDPELKVLSPWVWNMEKGTAPTVSRTETWFFMIPPKFLVIACSSHI